MDAILLIFVTFEIKISYNFSRFAANYLLFRINILFCNVATADNRTILPPRVLRPNGIAEHPVKELRVIFKAIYCECFHFLHIILFLKYVIKNRAS